MDPRQSRKERATLAKQIALAMEIPFALMAPVFLGGIAGYFIDRWLHTNFIFMLVLGFAGFGLGIRDTLKALKVQEKREQEEQNRKNQANDSEDGNLEDENFQDKGRYE